MQKLLVMSGGHLTRDTWSWLDAHLEGSDLLRPNNGIAALLAGGRTRYGWFMACPTEGQDELPGDLCAVLAHARKRGADYVAFKQDAIPLEDLPVLHPDFRDGADAIGTATPSA